MGKKNYNKISTEKVKENIEVAETKEETVVEPEVIETKDEPVTEPEAPKMVIGIVSGYTKLNVRKKPNANADVECVIPKNSEVEIEYDDGEFYEVCALPGNEYFHGYCMKKFISIKE